MGLYERFNNKKIAILGYGKEGKSSLTFLINNKVEPKNITILDANPTVYQDNFQDFNQYADLKVVGGTTYMDDLDSYDGIIKTPGISLYHPKLELYKSKITTQAQLFFDYYPGKIIAVSGTKGKSTTATLIYKTLQEAGKKVQLIGNIGNPVLEYLSQESLDEEEYVVFEVSSYMLEGLQKKNFLSILVNIYPDHLDWHQGFSNYLQAKLSLIKGSEHMLLRDEVAQKYPEAVNEQSKIFGHTGTYRYQSGIFYLNDQPLPPLPAISLQGEHNMMNICAVLGVCDSMDISYTHLRKVLTTFEGLPHRMQNIGTYKDITRIDDAISTTPESTIQAIQTFGHQIDTIFLGGTDRGYVFDELVKQLDHYKIQNIVLFPDSGTRILSALQTHSTHERNILQTSDMQEAVKFAYTHTGPGKICLLSTASPSYSVRKNFEEKGNLFAQYIQTLSH